MVSFNSSAGDVWEPTGQGLVQDRKAGIVDGLADRFRRFLGLGAVAISWLVAVLHRRKWQRFPGREFIRDGAIPALTHDCEWIRAYGRCMAMAVVFWGMVRR